MNITKTAKDKMASRIIIGAMFVAGIWFLTNMSGGSLLDEGSDAPLWTLKLADGTRENLSLESLKGKVVILDFWSIHCPPCLEEINVLKEIWRTSKDRGVVVAGVSVEGSSLNKIELFAKQRNIKYPLVVDTDGAISQQYKVRSLPTIYVLDRRGTIVAAHTGYWPKDDLLKAVDKALKN